MMRIYAILILLITFYKVCNLLFPFLSVSISTSFHSVLLSCSVEVLSACEHAAQLQRSEILEECEQGTNCCYTLQSVEKIMKKVRVLT